MARDGDDELIGALRDGLEARQVSMHISYRKARSVDGFREAFVEQVGARAVLIRDKFLIVSLIVLLIWFGCAYEFDLNDTTVLILGSPVTLGFLTFALVLLALVMFSRRYIRPLQGAPMHRAALRDADLFVALWRRGALALMTRQADDRLCQSPRDDWRQYVRRVLMLQGN